ncbi:MAG: hypothetical protein DRI57_21505 [Deltaproteobacteria bacterium]|nr:MAG: hypothetical protein DRI57_21505 [Deltaproteobacteria bacterium]
MPHGRTSSLYLSLSAGRQTALPSSQIPFKHMPWSQTPVVSLTLTISHPGLLPSGNCKPSAFPSGCPEIYPIRPQLYPFRGFRLPLPGLPAGLAADLSAQL